MSGIVDKTGSGQRRGRIVRVIGRLNVGGPARHVAWLTAGLRKAGFESLLMTGAVSAGEEDMSSFVESQGVVPLVIREMRREISLKDSLVVWKLYRLFRRLRPAIVHTHTAKAGTVGRLAGFFYRWLTLGTLLGRPRRCRFVHTYHGHIFHSYYGFWKTRLFLWIDRSLARWATDRIIVISPQQYHEIHEQFGIGRAEQFAVIPLGLDLSAFSDWRSRRRRVREELGAQDGELLVGIVGRLTEIKNHSLFLEAAALFKNRSDRKTQRPVRFLVIGDGHLRVALEEQSRALGVENDVCFLGMRNDPEDFYPALDVVVLASRNEGTPLTLIEAMANARPVIATAVGGVVDLLGEAATPNGSCAYKVCERGILVRPNDAEALCGGLIRLVGDESLRRTLAERGQCFIEGNYAKERLVADVSSLYSDLLQPEAGHEQALQLPCLPAGVQRERRRPLRVLITGGAGFVGSHLADAYLRRGDEVYTLDDLSTGSIDNIQHLKKHPRFHYTIDSVHNQSAVAELVDLCDVVFHLAAAVGVKLIVNSPVRTIETNVHGTEVVLAQASKKKKKVLIASTSEVYGLSSRVPFREDGQLVMGPTTKGRWSYACSKAMDEFLAIAYWREKELPTVIVRLFNTVGPRQTGQYGMVIPTFVTQALTGRPITVYGDGSQTRCFGYVGDVVNALIELMEHPAAVGQVFNIGSDEEVSIGELAEMVKDLTHSPSEIVSVPYEEAYAEGFEDMPRRVPDISKVAALIGFRPSMTLKQILHTVIAYLRDHPRAAGNLRLNPPHPLVAQRR